MTIEYTVSEQDYLNFNLYHLDNSRYAKSTKQILRYGAAGLIMLTHLVMFRGQLPAFIVSVLFAVIWILLSPKIYDSIIKNSVKKYISEGKTNDFIGPQKLILKDDCIEEHTGESSSTTRYYAVERIGFGYGCIFIYIGAIKAYIIPDSAFKDTEERDRFLNIIREKAGMKSSVLSTT